MNKDTLTFDEGARRERGPQLVEGGVYPFPGNTDDQTVEAKCIHCDRLVAITDEEDGAHFGVIGMNSGEYGLIATYGADALRDLAKQLGRMADYLDTLNKEGVDA